MKTLFTLLTISLLIISLTIIGLLAPGCSRDITTPKVVDVSPQHEIWKVEGNDGNWFTFDNEVEALDKVDELNAQSSKEKMSDCWHATQIGGIWYFRHCGNTLSQECYVYYGHMMFGPCPNGGPGGDW